MNARAVDWNKQNITGYRTVDTAAQVRDCRLSQRYW